MCKRSLGVFVWGGWIVRRQAGSRGTRVETTGVIEDNLDGGLHAVDCGGKVVMGTLRICLEVSGPAGEWGLFLAFRCRSSYGLSKDSTVSE